MEARIARVNDRDEVIGSCTKADQIKPEIITQNAIVVLQDSALKYILQVRAFDKKFFPGCYDFAACGSVDAGEDYSDAAARELFEELGINTTLRALQKIYRIVPASEGSHRYFTTFFHGTYDGEFHPSKDVEKVVKVVQEELEHMIGTRARGIEDYFVQEWEILKKLLPKQTTG